MASKQSNQRSLRTKASRRLSKPRTKSSTGLRPNLSLGDLTTLDGPRSPPISSPSTLEMARSPLEALQGHQRSRQSLKDHLFGLHDAHSGHSQESQESEERSSSNGHSDLSTDSPLRGRLSRTGTMLAKRLSVHKTFSKSSSTLLLGGAGDAFDQSSSTSDETYDWIRDKANQDRIAAMTRRKSVANVEGDGRPLPVRRRSLLMPGLATRDVSDPLRKLPLITTSDDDATSRGYYRPSLSTASPFSTFSGLGVPAPTYQQQDRPHTPADLDYGRIGGGLRITNGAPSPEPSLHEREDDMPCLSPVRDDYFTASEGLHSDLETASSQGSAASYLLQQDARTRMPYAPSYERDTLRPEDARQPLRAEVPVAQARPASRHRPSSSIPACYEPLRPVENKRATISHARDLSSELAMEYMAELGSGPYNAPLHHADRHSILEASSKTSAFDDQLFEDDDDDDDTPAALSPVTDRQAGLARSMEDQFPGLSDLSSPQASRLLEAIANASRLSPLTKRDDESDYSFGPSSSISERQPQYLADSGYASSVSLQPAERRGRGRSPPEAFSRGQADFEPEYQRPAPRALSMRPAEAVDAPPHWSAYPSQSSPRTTYHPSTSTTAFSPPPARPAMKSSATTPAPTAFPSISPQPQPAPATKPSRPAFAKLRPKSMPPPANRAPMTEHADPQAWAVPEVSAAMSSRLARRPDSVGRILLERRRRSRQDLGGSGDGGSRRASIAPEDQMIRDAPTDGSSRDDRDVGTTTAAAAAISSRRASLGAEQVYGRHSFSAAKLAPAVPAPLRLPPPPPARAAPAPPPPGPWTPSPIQVLKTAYAHSPPAMQLQQLSARRLPPAIAVDTALLLASPPIPDRSPKRLQRPGATRGPRPVVAAADEPVDVVEKPTCAVGGERPSSQGADWEAHRRAWAARRQSAGAALQRRPWVPSDGSEEDDEEDEEAEEVVVEEEETVVVEPAVTSLEESYLPRRYEPYHERPPPPPGHRSHSSSPGPHAESLPHPHTHQQQFAPPEFQHLSCPPPPAQPQHLAPPAPPREHQLRPSPPSDKRRSFNFHLPLRPATVGPGTSQPSTAHATPSRTPLGAGIDDGLGNSSAPGTPLSAMIDSLQPRSPAPFPTSSRPSSQSPPLRPSTYSREPSPTTPGLRSALKPASKPRHRHRVSESDSLSRRNDEERPTTTAINTGSSRHQSALTESNILRLAGRYDGGFAFGYEPGAGLGGSAGTRSAAGKRASRKSGLVSSGFGVDLSDVPIFVTRDLVV